MNFYIVDDDPSIPMVLQRILERDPDNVVVGTATDSKKALADLMLMNVDIALVDLLMPNMSGIELIQKIKQNRPQMRFIMISQVHDVDLRAEAYNAGIEFFIDKPINVIEVKTVVKKVVQSIQMEDRLSNIHSLANFKSHTTATIKNRHKIEKEKLLSILRFLGITSKTGSSDILAIAQIMINQNLSFDEIDFKEYHLDDHEKKILFQRIRRAIKAGLTNVADLFLDSMGDEIVTEYANSLYGYKNVHNEILFLNGTRNVGGKVSLKYFFDGLIKECQNSGLEE